MLTHSPAETRALGRQLAQSLQAGDVLVSVNGVPATDPTALRPQSGLQAAEGKMTLVIYRGGEEITLFVSGKTAGNSEK